MDSSGPNWERLRNDQDFLAIFHTSSRLAERVTGMREQLCTTRDLSQEERQYLIGFNDGVQAVRFFPDQELNLKHHKQKTSHSPEGEREHESRLRNMLSRGLRMVGG